MPTVLVVGAAGNAGRAITALLLMHSEVAVRLAGRNLSTLRPARAALLRDRPEDVGRTSVVAADATSSSDLARALHGADLCVLAAGTADHAPVAVEACLQAGVSYLDLQVNAGKTAYVLARGAAAARAGVRLITDGGFHPGVPAAMVRYALGRVPDLDTALVGSVIAVDWRRLSRFADSTMTEFMSELGDYRYQEYRAGRWQRPRRQPAFDFANPFGRRRVAAMGLQEMHDLVAAHPQLQRAGFYVGGFNPVTDYALLPAAMAGMALAPNRLANPLGRLMGWSLSRFSRPPYGTVLQLDAAAAGGTPRRLLRLRHPDAYTMTAAPVVATALQLLSAATMPEGVAGPGAWTQGMWVAPNRFFADLGRMGVEVSWYGHHPAQAGPAAGGSRP